MEVGILFRKLLYFPFFIASISAFLWMFTGCGGKYMVYEQKLLQEADSLFKERNYEYAKVKFDKVRTLKPNSPAARTAQYYLGYINIYYENPFASWEAALREFKLFVSKYPDDSRVDEVNSWIRMLVVLQSFKKDYLGTTSELRELQKKSIEDVQAHEKPEVNVNAIMESLRNCQSVRDSLNKKSKDLENFILDLEKECVEAGK